MSDTLIKRRIHRFFSTGKAEEVDDEIVKEHRLQIRLDGKDFVQAALSPNLLEEFVLGFLRTRGLISGIQDLVSLEIAGTTASAVRNSQSRQTIPELTLLESTGSRNIDRDSAFRLAASISPSEPSRFTESPGRRRRCARRNAHLQEDRWDALCYSFLGEGRTSFLSRGHRQA